MIVAIGGLLFGFDTAVISGAIGLIKDQFSLDTVTEGWLVSSGLAGCIAGVLLTGLINEKIGRRKSIIVAAFMFLLSGLGCAFASSFSSLVTSRIIGGVGVGMASVISPMYIAEFAPAPKRGRMIGYYQLAITVGILLAYFSNAWIAQLSSSEYQSELLNRMLHLESWRMMFLVMSGPSVILLLLLVKVPESPRWLVEKGEVNKAKKILLTIRPLESAQKELADIERARQRHSLSSTSLRTVRLPLLIGIVLAILQQFSGINAIIYYGPAIFESAGLPSSNALIFQAIIGAVNVLFTFVALKYSDKYGRKSLLKFGLLGIIISLIGCGLLFYTGNTHGASLLVLMLVYIACFAFSLGPVTWIIINEIFPNHVRAKAVALCTLCLWVAVWMVGQFFPWLLEKTGSAVTFWVFALFSIINLIFSLRIVKETSGKTLEEMEEVFVAPH
jgi:SP family arabinose:H+ symporter-like MFS transporter